MAEEKKPSPISITGAARWQGRYLSAPEFDGGYLDGMPPETIERPELTDQEYYELVHRPEFERRERFDQQRRFRMLAVDKAYWPFFNRMLKDILFTAKRHKEISRDNGCKLWEVKEAFDFFDWRLLTLNYFGRFGATQKVVYYLRVHERLTSKQIHGRARMDYSHIGRTLKSLEQALRLKEPIIPGKSKIIPWV